MRIVHVTCGLPYPPDSGARLRDFHLIRHVAERAEVSLLSLLTSPQEADGVAGMRRHCRSVEVHGQWQRPAWRMAADGLADLARGRPAALWPFTVPEFAAKVREAVVREDADVLQIEHSLLAAYRDCVPLGSRCRTVLSFHNVCGPQYRSLAPLARGPVRRAAAWGKAWLARGWEAKWGARFDRCLVVSPLEREWLRTDDPKLPVEVIENGVDVEALQPLDEPSAGNDLLFVGVMGYPPNADAAVWFSREILPLVRREVPDARLLVVGHAPRPEVARLHDGSQVFVTGSVPDVVPFYRQARLCVVPLRGGGGTRLKVLEALALGRPVVTTAVGCEGLAVEDGVHAAIADEAPGFARRVVELLQCRELRSRMAGQGRRLVEARYAWPVIARRLLAVYDELVSGVGRQGNRALTGACR